MRYLLAGLLLLFAGCNLSHAPKTDRQQARVEPTDIGFYVKNLSWSDANVYIYKGRSELRKLSLFPSMSDDTRCVREAILGGSRQVSLVVDPTDGGKKITVRANKNLKAGDLVTLTLLQPLHLTNITDIHNVGNVEVLCSNR